MDQIENERQVYVSNYVFYQEMDITGSLGWAWQRI